jgi:hypothetical protein
MGLVRDVAAAMLRGAGYPELADWTIHAPEKAGEAMGRVLAEGLRSDGSFTPEAIKELQELKQASPSPTAQSPPNLLGEYVADLNAIAARACNRQAVAVRGFLHCKDCLVLWHFIKQPHPAFREDKTDSRIWIFESGTDIYIGPAVDAQKLIDFNLALEKEESVALKSIIENHCESKVRFITKNDVALSLLRPPRKGKDEATMAIESSDGIVEAMRTMTIAIAAQEKRLQDWKHATTETLKKPGE